MNTPEQSSFQHFKIPSMSQVRSTSSLWLTAISDSFDRGRGAYRASHPVRKKIEWWRRIYFYFIAECPTRVGVVSGYSMEEREVLATSLAKDYYELVFVNFVSEGQVVPHGSPGPAPVGRGVVPAQVAPIR